MEKPACYEIVPPCWCKECQLYDVREIVPKLHFEPRFSVATVCPAMNLALSTSRSALPIAALPVCDCPVMVSVFSLLIVWIMVRPIAVNTSFCPVRVLILLARRRRVFCLLLVLFMVLPSPAASC